MSDEIDSDGDDRNNLLTPFGTTSVNHSSKKSNGSARPLSPGGSHSSVSPRFMKKLRSRSNSVRQLRPKAGEKPKRPPPGSSTTVPIDDEIRRYKRLAKEKEEKDAKKKKKKKNNKKYAPPGQSDTFSIPIPLSEAIRACYVTYRENTEETEIWDPFGEEDGECAPVQVAFVRMDDLLQTLESLGLSTWSDETDSEEEEEEENIPPILKDVKVTCYTPEMFPNGTCTMDEATPLMRVDDVFQRLLVECSIHPGDRLSTLVASFGIYASDGQIAAATKQNYRKVAADRWIGSGPTSVLPGCIYPHRFCRYYDMVSHFKACMGDVYDLTEKSTRDTAERLREIQDNAEDTRNMIRDAQGQSESVAELYQLLMGTIKSITEDYLKAVNKSADDYRLLLAEKAHVSSAFAVAEAQLSKAEIENTYLEGRLGMAVEERDRAFLQMNKVMKINKLMSDEKSAKRSWLGK